jgi:hypothetical protein
MSARDLPPIDGSERAGRGIMDLLVGGNAAGLVHSNQNGSPNRKEPKRQVRVGLV